MSKDPRIDAYIDKAQPFAQEILRKFRSIIHDFCPEVVETMKWSFPHYMYKNTILCSTASFKAHCAFGFWMHHSMSDQFGLFKREQEGGMGSIGKMRSMNDIPPREQLGVYIHEAMQLIEAGVKLKTTSKTPRAVEIPEDLAEILTKNPQAQSFFDSLSPSHKREYTEWISNAKREETRLNRLKTTLNNLLEGKTKEWKYQKK